MAKVNASIEDQLTNEAAVELRIVIPLMQSLGFDLEDFSPKHPVKFQHGRKIPTGRKPEADFVLFASADRSDESALVVIEAKRPGEDLAASRAQAESYAFATRAPFVVLCDGKDLDVWRVNRTYQSERILSLQVKDIEASRGELELVLHKRAILKHNKALRGPSTEEIIRDFSEYERAEEARTEAYSRIVSRRIKPLAGGGLSSLDFLDKLGRGAVITGGSGLGKTSLGFALFRGQLSRRVSGPATLPVHLNLPEIGEGEGLLDYAIDRILAHSTGLTKPGMLELVRRDGVLLVIDGFDRVEPAAQAKRSAEARRLLRDHLQLRLVVLSRASAAPALDLPVFALEPLDHSERRAILATRDNPKLGGILMLFPPLLEEIASNPLIFIRTVEHYERTGDLPTRLDVLFQDWLDSVLHADARDLVGTARRETGLAALAKAARSGRVERGEAVAVVQAAGCPPDTLNELVGCDALIVEQGSLSFTHEALSDFLIARSIAYGSPDEVMDKIDHLKIDPDSLLPTLLMSLLRSSKAQAALWQRMSGVGLALYLDALRYRGETGEEDDGDVPYQNLFLEEVRDGAELAINQFFPGIRDALMFELAGGYGQRLGIIGDISERMVAFSFVPASEGAALVRIGNGYAERKRTKGYAVGSHRPALALGRLFGIKDVRMALKEVFEFRSLSGGAAWRSERLCARLAFIHYEHQAPLRPSAPLKQWRSLLRPDADHAVTARYDRKVVFLIRDVLDDVDVLLAQGVTELEDWAEPIREETCFELNNDQIAGLVRETYARQQVLVKEIAEASFAPILAELAYYAALPVRYQITLDPRVPNKFRPSGRRVWLPVSDWRDAGADVTIEPEREPFDDGYFNEVTAALIKLGRQNGRPSATIMSGSLLPDGHGTQMKRLIDTESPALISAINGLWKDLERLFDEMPDT